MSEHSDGAATWQSAAAAVLRKVGRLGADDPDSAVVSRLARRRVDGMTTPAIGVPADLVGLPTATVLDSAPGQAPFLRGGRSEARWDVRARIAEADAAAAKRAAMAELTGGVTSLWLAVGGDALAPSDLAAALDGVDLTIAPVVLDAVDGDLAAARALADLAAARGAALHPSSSLGADPIGLVARGALDAAADHVAASGSLADQVAVAAELADGLGIGAIVVDGTVVHDAGASDAQEIGYTLAAGAAYLRMLTGAGVAIDTACRLISFRYAVTDEQFTQIAKLRAARVAWARVCELSAAAPTPQRQHAVTSAAMLTRYDPHTNMLRATVATFAAAVGGADAVTTLPFDAALGAPDDFSRRMARNVSALLTGESSIDQVADPSGGAPAVERLTADLAEAAWSEFTDIERVGGIQGVLADGSLAAAIAEVRARREQRIATRAIPITGVSEFPQTGETASDLPERAPAVAQPRVRRWAEPFEALRDEPTAAPVLLVRIGTEAAASARVTFTTNLLAAAGIAVRQVAADALPGDLDGAVAMIAGADRDYAEQLEQVVAALRSGGVATVLLAGRPRGVDIPDGVTAFAAGENVLEFAAVVRAALGGAR